MLLYICYIFESKCLGFSGVRIIPICREVGVTLLWFHCFNKTVRERWWKNVPIFRYTQLHTAPGRKIGGLITPETNIETPWSTKLPCSRKPPQAKINEFTRVKHSRHYSSLSHQKQPLGLLTLFLCMFLALIFGGGWFKSPDTTSQK